MQSKISSERPVDVGGGGKVNMSTAPWTNREWVNDKFVLWSFRLTSF